MQFPAKLQQALLISVLTLSVCACGNDVSKGTEPKQVPDTTKESQTNSNNSMSVARQEVNTNKMTANIMTMKGQVVFQTMEGGFYSFIAENGDKYTPMQLPKAHQRNGLIIEVEAEELHDVMTTTQFGKVIKIHNATIIDESKVSEIKQNL